MGWVWSGPGFDRPKPGPDQAPDPNRTKPDWDPDRIIGNFPPLELRRSAHYLTDKFGKVVSPYYVSYVMILKVTVCMVNRTRSHLY